MKSFFIATALLVSASLQAKTLKFMQYNAENFYDTKFDQGTEDYTYLPLSVKRSLEGHSEYCEKLESFRKNECLYLDWTEEKFTKKIMNVSKVIKAFDSTGNGPDIVALEEIENINVLQKLIAKGLGQSGFRHAVLIEGDDSRGIDVGLISKYPVISSKRHPLIMNNQTLDTRGILEVTLEVESKLVVVFVNHWPSQNNPVKERIASATLLEKAASVKRADLIIATGDFNTVKSDSPNPYDSMKSFIDTEKKAREVNRNLHPGTTYHRGQWNSLDKIFVHKSSVMAPDYSTYRIFNHAFLFKSDSGARVPNRYNHETGEGFSDHLPVGIEFNY